MYLGYAWNVKSVEAPSAAHIICVYAIGSKNQSQTTIMDATCYNNEYTRIKATHRTIEYHANNGTATDYIQCYWNWCTAQWSKEKKSCFVDFIVTHTQCLTTEFMLMSHEKQLFLDQIWSSIWIIHCDEYARVCESMHATVHGANLPNCNANYFKFSPCNA